jgi:hypothetical protein
MQELILAIIKKNISWLAEFLLFFCKEYGASRFGKLIISLGINY